MDDLFSGSIKRKASGEDGVKKQRACGLCKQPGHTRYNNISDINVSLLTQKCLDIIR